MLNTLANHNRDIAKLLEKGYALGWDSGYLIVRDIPYLDKDLQLQTGAFIMKVEPVDEHRIRMSDHTLLFCGSHPHELNGDPIAHLGGGATSLPLTSDDLTVQRSFSHKPPDGYKDFLEKIETYVTVISGPAINKYGANPLTYNVKETNEDSLFNYIDSLSSRAEITHLSRLFKDDIVAIIGLGGTGSYVLDFLAKMQVREIRGFDVDYYHVHNAFRSPGRLIKDELGKTKAEVYQRRYEGFRRGIHLQSKIIQADALEDLQGVTFAFVCVDKGPSRKEVVEALAKLQIPFIDVGMGLDLKRGPISGTLRATYVEPAKSADILAKEWLPMTNPEDDEYRTQIQIAELNALNASLAVIKFKQLRGFYVDDSASDHFLLTIDNLQLVKE
jgi:hypothetical protein